KGWDSRFGAVATPTLRHVRRATVVAAFTPLIAAVSSCLWSGAQHCPAEPHSKRVDEAMPMRLTVEAQPPFHVDFDGDIWTEDPLGGSPYDLLPPGTKVTGTIALH